MLRKLFHHQTQYLSTLLVAICILTLLQLANADVFSIADEPCLPRGVRIQYSRQYTGSTAQNTNTDQYLIIFYTQDPCQESFVTVNANPIKNEFVPKNFSISQTIHYNDSQPTDELNGPFKFILQSKNQGGAVIIFIADYDATTPAINTTKYLTQQANGNGPLQAIVNMGDIAYDLYSDGGKRGLQYMQLIEPFTSQVPQMNIAGNHETLDEYKYYKLFFPNPSGDQSILYYSWSVGNVHLVSLIFENDVIKNATLRKNQLEWLKNDLKEAQSSNYSWIVVYVHRPLYCSMDNPVKRSCIDVRGKFDDYESVLREAKVDLFLAGHMHLYERTLPVYNYSVQNFSNVLSKDGKSACYDAQKCSVQNKKNCNVFINPQGTIHVVEGAAGNSYYFKDDYYPLSNWSVRMQGVASVGRLQTFNATHLTYEHILTNTSEVIDSFTIVKFSNSDAGNTQICANQAFLEEAQQETAVQKAVKKMLLTSLIIIIIICAGVALYKLYRKRQTVEFVEEDINLQEIRNQGRNVGQDGAQTSANKKNENSQNEKYQIQLENIFQKQDYTIQNDEK